MKILITGGAGYIGSVLVKKLLEWKPISLDALVNTGNGIRWSSPIEKITVVDNLIRKQNVLGEFVTDSRFEFIKTNIDSFFTYQGDMHPFHKGDEIDVTELACFYDVVIPLAGIVGAPRCQEEQELSWKYNRIWIFELIKELEEHAPVPPKVIFPCTNSGYGSRPDGAMITEEDPLRPVSAYGRSKVAAEKDILSYGGISLRLATVMGWSPCMRLDLLVNDFVWQAVKRRNIVLFEKHFKRNYIHVEDVAQAFILAIEKYYQMGGQSFNVGLSSANLSKEELSKKIAEHIELHIIDAPLMEDPDKRDYIVSNEKIEALGFKPRWDIDSTIEQLIKFYQTVGLDSANIFYENWK